MRVEVVAMFGSVLLACGASGVPAGSLEAGRRPSATDQSASPCRGPLPSPSLQAPAGNELEFAFNAVGVQIYTCTSTSTGPAWVFSAPDATLFDDDGAVAGRHYAGPTWESIDGSKVVAAKVAGATVDPASIPWLLLEAVSHTGEGRMDEVSYIQRIATSGGLAPSSGCEASTAGAVARVPYTATYCFYEAE